MDGVEKSAWFTTQATVKALAKTARRLKRMRMRMRMSEKVGEIQFYVQVSGSDSELCVCVCVGIKRVHGKQTNDANSQLE